MSLFRRHQDPPDVTWPIVAIASDDGCVHVVPDAASLSAFVGSDATMWLAERRDPPGSLDLFDSAGRTLAPHVGPGWLVPDVHVASDDAYTDHVLKRIVAAVDEADASPPTAAGPRPDPAPAQHDLQRVRRTLDRRVRDGDPPLRARCGRRRRYRQPTQRRAHAQRGSRRDSAELTSGAGRAVTLAAPDVRPSAATGGAG